jgi:hypothetical protein
MGETLETKAKKRWRRGRPNSDPGKVKNNRITVRLSDEEVSSLQEKAHRLNMSPSQFLRDSSLSRDLPLPVPEINRMTYRELGRIGANFNQYLKQVCSGRIEAAADSLLQELAGILAVIRKEVTGYDRENKAG